MTNHPKSEGLKRTRKTRSDKGTHPLTDRDLFCFSWIADQYAVRFDQVRLLLSDMPEGETKDDLLAIPTVQGKIRKWVDGGYARYKRWLADGPGWVWLTRAGLNAIGRDDWTAKPPAVTRLDHIYAVNHIRLELDWHTWTSERRIKTIKTSTHHVDTAIPDAVITLKDDDTLIALEVELTIKKPDDLVRKVQRLVNNWPVSYPQVWFFVPNKYVKRALEQACKQIRADLQERITIYQVQFEGLPGGLE